MITRKRVTALLAALLVCVGFILPMPAQAANLPYWNSTADEIYRWESSPRIYYCLISGSTVPLYDGLTNAKTQWNRALGTSICFYSSGQASADIEFFAGDAFALQAVGYWPYVDGSLLGLTSYWGMAYQGTHTHSTSTGSIDIQWAYLYDVKAFAVEQSSNWPTGIYIKTITHEMGHAMGWQGHPPRTSAYSTWVMTQGEHANTTLAPGEKNHLAQIY